MKIIKISPKKLKVSGKMQIFKDRPYPPKKGMVCTLVKMLTFMDGPLQSYDTE